MEFSLFFFLFFFLVLESACWDCVGTAVYTDGVA